MRGEGERLFELAGEISDRLGEAFQGMIPDEAREHLIAAQKEVVTALMLIYEHRAGSRRERPARSFESDSRRLSDSESKAAHRSRRIEIE
ncbi:MAG: hypothetical protein ACREN8_02290 [Candidatus Dormibacteraceae bacterium]